MSLALLRPRVEELVGADRADMPLRRDRLVAAIRAARPGALNPSAAATLPMDELAELATEAERDAARCLDVAPHLQDAVLKYSRHRPAALVADIEGTGAWHYALPAEWVPGFSGINLVEYPAGRRPPAVLSTREYWLYRVPAGQHLAFRDLTPGPGETVRMEITIPHVMTEDATTVPEPDWPTIVKLAAGGACLQLATFYSHDSSPGADSVKHGSKGGELQKRGKGYVEEAEKNLPELETGKVVAAGGEMSFAGEISFLTH